jgi:hypothetical protein
MKLLELVNYFRKGGSFEEFCQSESLDLGSEVVEIYMEKPFDLNNDLIFCEIEKTEGSLEYSSNGVTYFNMFDFYYFLDAIEESNSDKNKVLSDNEIASRLLSYAIHDA